MGQVALHIGFDSIAQGNQLLLIALGQALLVGP
jgi:hypothetical protein